MRNASSTYWISAAQLHRADLTVGEVTALVVAYVTLMEGAFPGPVHVVTSQHTTEIQPGQLRLASDRVSDCQALLANASEAPLSRVRGTWILPGNPIDTRLADETSNAVIAVRVSEGGWSVAFRYRKGAPLVGERSVALLASLFEEFAEEALAHPDRPIGDYGVTSSTRALALAEIPATRAPAPFDRFVERFARIARTSAERPAVIAHDATLTYARLDELSDRLVAILRARGVTKGSRVLVLARRSPELVITFVAALKCGAALAVVDPTHPDAFIDACVTASNPGFVVDLAERSQCVGTLPVIDGITVDALAASPLEHRRAEEVLACDDTAFITFTSGTTRAPKAVAGRYGSLTYFFDWMEDTFGPFVGRRFGMCSSIGHDPLQRDILMPLYLGGAVCIPADDDITSPGRLRRWLHAEAVNTICVNPAMLALLDVDGPLLTELEAVFLVGSALSREHVTTLRRVAPHARVVNLYGSTESQRAVAFFEVPRAEDELGALPSIIPLGRGMKDVDVAVVHDDRTRVCVPYRVGEIVIRSRFVAKGYLNGSASDDGRFAPFGPSGDSHDSAYFTGDCGFYAPDAGVVFVGRKDGQRKIRGHRVDVDQIAAVCRENDAVRDAAALVVERAGRETLVAFVAPKSAYADVNADKLRSFIAERLPIYMVPDRVLSMDALPMTRNGKVDTRRLEEIAGESGLARAASRVGSLDAADVIDRFVRDRLGAVSHDRNASLRSLGLDSLSFVSLLDDVARTTGAEVERLRAHNGMSANELLDALADHARGARAVAPLSPIDRLGPATRVTEARITFGERSFDHFCSNSYLALNGDATIRHAVEAHVRTRGSIGAHGSFEINGYTSAHAALIAALRRFYDCDGVTLYGSCYMANLSAIASLAGPGDTILAEAGAHRSISDGCTLSRAEVRSFPRNDVAALERVLAELGDRRGRVIVIAEAVSGLHGDVLRLPEIARVVHAHRALLYVDEASSLGQLGAHGAGIEEHFDLRGAIDVRVGTFAKALASYGGYVTCDRALATNLRFKFGATFSTSITELQAVATHAALDALVRGGDRVRTVQRAAARWRDGLRRIGADVGASTTAIVPVFLRDRPALERLYSALLEFGVFCLPISPPWSAKYLALRTTVTAAHDDALVDAALERFAAAYRMALGNGAIARVYQESTLGAAQ